MMGKGTTTVGKIRYEVEVDSSGLATGIRQVENTVSSSTSKWSKGVDGFKTASEKAFNGVKTAAKVAMAAVGISIASSIESAVKRVDTLNNFPKVMQNLGVSSEDAADTINSLATKLKGLPTTLDSAASSVQRLTASTGDIKQAESIFLALNNAVLAGGQSMVLQETAVEQFSQAFAKGKMDVMEYRSLMSAMPAQMKQLADVMGIPFENLQEALTDSTSEFYVGVGGLSDAMVKMSTEGVNGFASLEEQARNATGGIGTSMEIAQTAVTRGISTMLESIGSENIKNAAEGLGNAFENIGIAIGNVITFLQENQWAWEILQVVLIAITATVLTLAASHVVLALAAMPVWGWIVVAVTAVIAIIVALVRNFGSVLDFFKMIGDWIYNNVVKPIGDFFSGLFEGIGNGLKSIGEFFTKIFGKIGEFVGGVFKGIANGWIAVVNGLIKGIEFIVNGFLLPFNLIIKGLNLIPGVDIPELHISLPQIPKLAEGGIVESTVGGRLIMAGEAGEDEWVVPESKMASMIEQLNAAGVGRGNAPVINVYGTFATSESEQRKVAQQIWDQLQVINRKNMGAMI